jgi:hypothetical protein
LEASILQHRGRIPCDARHLGCPGTQEFLVSALEQRKQLVTHLVDDLLAMSYDASEHAALEFPHTLSVAIKDRQEQVFLTKVTFVGYIKWTLVIIKYNHQH